MKLNICVDIDGTITEPFYWMEQVNRFFNKSIKPEEVNTYHIHELYHISREEFMAFYQEYGEIMHGNAKMRAGADIVLKKLTEIHNVYYVTARMQKMKPITEQWFAKYHIPYTEVFFLGGHDKRQKAKELECDIFIEDRYENAVQLSEMGINVLLVDCQYNRNELNDYITRVQSWYEIYDEVLKYTKAVIE